MKITMIDSVYEINILASSHQEAKFFMKQSAESILSAAVQSKKE